MRWSHYWLVAGVFAAGLIDGCDNAPPAPTTTTMPTYELPPRPVRLDERPLRLTPVVDGDTWFSLLGITMGMPQLTGSHADIAAKGRFVRIRISAANHGRTTAVLDLRRQRLVTGDGTTHRPDYDAMTIKRQPERIDLGASNLFEFDLWYDIPERARPAALVLYGGATLTDLRDIRGTRVRLP